MNSIVVAVCVCNCRLLYIHICMHACMYVCMYVCILYCVYVDRMEYHICPNDMFSFRPKESICGYKECSGTSVSLRH